MGPAIQLKEKNKTK